MRDPSDAKAHIIQENAAVSHRRGRESPLLTVIVPVFNESATIAELLRRVALAPYDKQIIVVDDGSYDGTHALIVRCQAEIPLDLYVHSRNRGKGRAIRTGLLHARGRYTIIQDADPETDPQDYPLLIEPLVSQTADFVLGSRFSHGRPRMTRPLRVGFRLGVAVLNLVVRILYRQNVSDEACCYKALPTTILRSMNLQCEGFDFCPEVVAKASRMGLRIREVGVSYFPRDSSKGKKLRYRDGLWALWALWHLRKWNPGDTKVSQNEERC